MVLGRRSFIKRVAGAVALLAIAPQKILAAMTEPIPMWESFHGDYSLTIKRWSHALIREAESMSYFHKFIGSGQNNIIVVRRTI